MQQLSIVLINNGLVLQFDDQSIFSPNLDGIIPALILSVAQLGKEENDTHDYLGPRTGGGFSKAAGPKKEQEKADDAT